MYSQGDEERYILRAVGATPGRFLDIGAYDGKTFSNTFALVERGWSGVMVEPGLEAFLALLRNHGDNNNLVLLHATVGLEVGFSQFWNTPDAVSTTQRGWYEMWKERGGPFGPPFWVPVVTVAQVLMQFSGPVDFLNIDTEGTSADLFLHFPLATVHPRAICVEHDQRVQECTAYAAKWGYDLLHQTPQNLVFQEH